MTKIETKIASVQNKKKDLFTIKILSYMNLILIS